MSEEKFKSQHLLTLRGEQTTIEILAEKKKAMGPGSLIDGKMYSRIKGKNYNSSLSFKIILRKELVSKLKEAGLLIGSQYKPYDYGDKDIEVLNIGDRNRLISAITDAKIKEKSIKFVSLVHGSNSNLPNTTLNANGTLRCWKCSISMSFDDYIRYVQSIPTDSSKTCKIVKTCPKDTKRGLNLIKSLDDFSLETVRGVFKILKANAGTGKSSKILGKAIDDPTRPYLVLAPFIKDCEAICGMYPSMIRQFGGSENRTREMNSHMMVKSFNTFGFGHYNDNVRAFFKGCIGQGGNNHR
jgi:hypothetical protein